LNIPNLASRPFLNTRPVWLLTAVAGTLALTLAAVNFNLWMISNRGLEEQLAREQALLAEQKQLVDELRSDAAALDQVPWRALNRRVDDLNMVLREHAFSWLRLLDDLERVLPREVRIIRVSPTVGKEDVELGLEGVARDRGALLDLLDNLIADPSFDEPRPRSERTPEQSSGVGYDFVLSVKYRPEGGRP
jgi:Tfp pilus assembly protein PilN